MFAYTHCQHTTNMQLWSADTDGAICTGEKKSEMHVRMTVCKQCTGDKIKIHKDIVIYMRYVHKCVLYVKF